MLGETVSGTYLLRMGWLLIPSFLVLYPGSASFYIPFVGMALLGLWQMFSSRDIWHKRHKVVWITFLAVWLPMVMSLPGAADLERSGQKVFAFVAYPPAAFFILSTLKSEALVSRLCLLTFGVILFWCVDAIFQWLTGFNVLGYPLNDTRLQGIFYPRWHLGTVLATLSPVYFDVVRRLAVKSIFAVLLLVPLLLVIILNGTRAGWFMLVVGTVLYLIYLHRQGIHPALTVRRTVSLVGILGLCALLSLQYPGVMKRASALSGLFSLDLEQVDQATKYRLSIWGPSLSLASDHWFNGVGPRGFREVFLEYANEDNFWSKRDPPGVLHPHLVVLEILIETGVIGLVGYLLLFSFVAWALWRRSGTDPRLATFGIALLILIFPVNTHTAFYGSKSSALMWWLLFIFLASVVNNPVRRESARITQQAR